jgi:hypothetical protein
MSKLKRMRKKQAAQKKTNIRKMALDSEFKETLGTRKLLRRMTREHLDVLENIESVFVSAYHEDGSIDDRLIAEVLKAAIRDEEPVSARAQWISDDLDEVRHLRPDVTDDIWRDGLKTVLQSVRRHSNLRPGEREYLDFVSYCMLA